MSTDNEELSRRIKIHSIINPPSIGQSLDVKINCINTNHLIIDDWNNDDPPNFLLRIIEPKSIGLVDFQENNVEDFMNDIILSCNIIMSHATFSKHQSDSTKTVIKQRKLPSIPPTIENTPNGRKISFTDVLTITDSIHITMGFEDELDENKILNILSKICMLKKGKSKDNLKITDLQKSLNEFTSAMSSFNRLSIFKHLFSSLELSINSDGIDRKNHELDNEIHKITDMEISKIEDFRRFNARTKHIDKNSQDEQLYKDGMKDIGMKIVYLQEAAKKSLISRLN